MLERIWNGWRASYVSTAGQAADGATASALKEAYEQVEDEEDEHLYHTKGWCRELWLDFLGIDAELRRIITTGLESQTELPYVPPAAEPTDTSADLAHAQPAPQQPAIRADSLSTFAMVEGARVAPTPLSTVRRERCFLVMNISVSCWLKP